ncbi:hypothetical protein Tco_0578981, partial [Tanacetum coccineum]
MSNDPFPKSSQYNAKHFTSLVAHPGPFHKYTEPFLCLIGISRNYTFDLDTYPRFLHGNDEDMDLFSFIRTADPFKVKVVERQRGEDEPKLLDTTVGRTVPLLLVAPARASSEVEASVDKLFDKEGATVFDFGEPSHPAKKLRDGHEVLSGPTIGGKSQSAIHRLLVGAVLNAEVRGETAPTFPFVTSSVSATQEREEGDHTNSLVGANLRTIGAPQRFVISLDSSHHSGANIVEAEVDYVLRSSILVMTAATAVTATASVTPVIREAVTKPSLFAAASSSAGGTEHTPAGFSSLTGTDLLVGDIRTVIDPDSDLQKVCHEMVDEFAPPRFSASVHGMKHDLLFAEFNMGAARQMSLSAEAKGKDIDDLKAQLLVKEANATKAIRLHAEGSKFEAIKKSRCDELKLLKECNAALEEEKGLLDVKVADLTATVKVREQEAADSDAMVTTVKLHNNSLTDQ